MPSIEIQINQAPKYLVFKPHRNLNSQFSNAPYMLLFTGLDISHVYISKKLHLYEMDCLM